MARVQAISKGYYNHRKVKPGDEIEMLEVDSEGFYVGEKGKRKLFPKLDREGKPVLKDGKAVEEERKCRWVGKIGAFAAVKVDPKQVAATLSGKTPGVANPIEKKE